MNSTKVERIVQKVMKQIEEEFPLIKKIINDLHSEKKDTACFLVGGAVRDAFLDMPIKDLDIEVYGIALDDLESFLRQYGFVRKVGKVFGVFKIDGIPVDWSLPRIDGVGRKPSIQIDSQLSYQQAFSRRDITINAIGINLLNGQIVDPFNGIEDLKNKILRAVNNNFFQEDPLRYFRIMQFIARFNFLPDEKLYEIGKCMNLSDISSDRIKEEFYKLFIMGKKPSLGLQWLVDTDRLKDILPELHGLIGLEQDVNWHPEGDVFEHTKQAVDAAAFQHYNNDEDKYSMVLSALCHDLGKLTTTKKNNGKISSLGHDIAGVELAKKILDVIAITKKIVPKITKLVRWHMTPFSFIKNNAGSAAYKRLAMRLAPETSCKELGLLVLCDKSARNPLKNEPFFNYEEPMLKEFLMKAESYGVLYNQEEPILKGSDLVGHISAGRDIGIALHDAYTLQIENGIVDKEELKKRVLLCKKRI